ncbi:MAG: DUF4198 domain-containing protein [Candidatus Aminicenantes bacterium]|nr:DUF4198 domain-containing protein [Candidatus Aminicenantes bacterium]
MNLRYGRIIRTAGAAIFCLTLGSIFLCAHFNWIHPEKPLISTGETVNIFLASGHHFAEVTSSPSSSGLSVFAVTPSGERRELQAIQQEKILTAEYNPDEAGLHILCFEINRGIMSRTTKGWQPGGCKEYPQAKQSMKFYASAVSYLRTSTEFKEEGKTVGLAFQLTAERKDSLIRLEALKESQPVEGVEVSVVVEGGDALKIGKSDEQGKIVYSLQPGYKGRILFVAAKDTPMPDSADFATERIQTSLCLYIE